jgi:predicted neuraminidase
MMRSMWAVAAVLMMARPLAAEGEKDGHPAIVRSEFIYEKARFPQCHASTIAETKGGLVSAWFGGKFEGHREVGIWLSRHVGGKWTVPVEVAAGTQQEKRYPCWNPVLFQPARGDLMLFYKVGPKPSSWWGVLITSADGGKTWSPPRRLTEGILGPIKNKPIELADGTLLCGSSDESQGWRVFMERLAPAGNWHRVGPLNDGKTMAVIQPTILRHGGKRLQILCRSKQGVIVTSWSEDDGKKWSELKPIALPNPNSGLDAVTLKDGRHLLVYNHTRRGRSPLNVAVSKDGKTWKPVVVLEKEAGEYSYPAVIQTADGLVHITYTWKRQRVKHVVVDPSKLS